MSGENPDYSEQELWEAIDKGEEIVWNAKVQIMEPAEADANILGFDPFDVTKVWPRNQFPLRTTTLARCNDVADSSRCITSAAWF